LCKYIVTYVDVVQIREGHERIGTNQLAYHLSHLKDGIIETISRKVQYSDKSLF